MTEKDLKQERQGDGEYNALVAIEYEMSWSIGKKWSELIFETSKLYMYWQFGLAAAVGIITSNDFLTFTVSTNFGYDVNVPIFLIASIGFISGIAAIFVGRTMNQYADIAAQRAKEIEDNYDLKLMTKMDDRLFSRYRPFAGMRVALTLFVLIGIAWLFAAYNSFIPSKV